MAQERKEGNIFAELPGELPHELFQTLAQTENLCIERIVSRGHVTPDGEWYDQQRDEWVLLLSGGAELLFQGEESPRRLVPGDWLLIPARCRHRVAWTAPGEASVWLAVHFQRGARP